MIAKMNVVRGRVDLVEERLDAFSGPLVLRPIGLNWMPHGVDVL